MDDVNHRHSPAAGMLGLGLGFGFGLKIRFLVLPRNSDRGLARPTPLSVSTLQLRFF